jgi:mannose-6-phosphate isomerase-like protein (cupin superfamily)
VETTNAGYQFWFVDSTFARGKTVKLSVVRPGAAKHPPHVHAEDEFYFILEGTAELFLNGKTGIAGPMTCFYCPSNVEHGIRNAGDVELKYLVIKKYSLKR